MACFRSQWPTTFGRLKARGRSLLLGAMRKKKIPKEKPEEKPEEKLKDERKHKPSRTEQARKIAEEYASDQREVIEKLRKPLN